METEECTFHQEKLNPEFQCFGGFSTASGKKTLVSKKSLELARKIFEEANKDTECSNGTNNIATGSGLPNGVSDQIVATPVVDDIESPLFSPLMGDRNSLPPGTSHLPCFTGFSTASGRREMVHEKALENAKWLFEDSCKDTHENIGEFSNGDQLAKKLDFSEESETAEFSFAAASGKKTKAISQSSLQKARKFFSETEILNHKTDSNQLSHLSGRLSRENLSEPIKPSEKKLFRSSRSEYSLPRDPVEDLSCEKILLFPNGVSCSSYSKRKARVSDILRKKARLSPELSISTSSSGLSPKSLDVGTPAVVRKSRSVVQLRGVHKEGAEELNSPSHSNVLGNDNFFEKEALSPAFDSSVVSQSYMKSSPKQFFNLRKDNCGLSPVTVSPTKGNLRKFIQRRKHWDKSPFFRPFVSPVARPAMKKETFYRTPPPAPVRQHGKLLEIRKSKTSVPLSVALSGLLPESYTSEQLIHYGVLEATFSVTSETAADFYFTKEYVSSVGESETVELGDCFSVMLDNWGGISVEEMERGFFNCSTLNKSLLPAGWFKNHYRWIVYKLAALEVTFPLFFARSQLTPDRVALQLKYRYDREIELGERSALRRITEGDDSAAKPLILCISKITKQSESTYLLEMTDGWYCVPCSVDCFLSRQITVGNMTVGTKLFIFGASLSGFEGGHHPLELPDTVSLRLEGNGVRRAKWDCRMGYYSLKSVPWFSLVSLIPHGGLVSAVLKLQVLKVFPIRYLERCPDGKVVSRSQKEEHIAATKFELYRMSVVERIFEAVRSEYYVPATFYDCSQDVSDNTPSQCGGEDWQSGEGIYDILKKTPDPARIRSRLSDEQKELLTRFLAKRRDLKIEGIRSELENVLKQHEDEIPVRKVSSQLPAQVLSLHPSDKICKAAAVLNIYNPGEDLFHLLKEGKVFRVQNLLVYEQRKKAGSVDSAANCIDGGQIVVRLATTRTSCFY